MLDTVPRALKNSLIISGAILFIVIILLFLSPLFIANNSGSVVGQFGKYVDQDGGFYEEGQHGKGVSSIFPPEISDGVTTIDPTIKRQIIRMASLSLLVKKSEDTAKDIMAIAENAGGFVEGSYFNEVSDGVKNGTITIRVPTKDFFSIIDNIKKLAINVETESINAEDVTDQIVDIDARLKNLYATETQYRAILERAVKIEDVLNVQARLNETREQIERLLAQKINIENRASMSTIIASLISEPDVAVFGIEWRPLYIAKLAVREALTDLRDYTDWMTRFIIKLPVLLLRLATYLAIAILILFGARKLYYFGKNKLSRNTNIKSF